VTFPDGLLLADKSAWERAGHEVVRESGLVRCGPDES
jgi:hypothetical protein